MQGLFKLAAYMAPVFIFVLLIVIARMDKHDADMAAEMANFEKEWDASHFVEEEPQKWKEFWRQQLIKAEKQLELALKEQTKARGNVTQQTELLDKTLDEMDFNPHDTGVTK